jgi:hypothetical protein
MILSPRGVGDDDGALLGVGGGIPVAEKKCPCPGLDASEENNEPWRGEGGIDVEVFAQLD